MVLGGADVLTYRYTGVLGLGVALLMVFAAGILVRAGLMAVGAPDEELLPPGDCRAAARRMAKALAPGGSLCPVCSLPLSLFARGVGPGDILLAGALSLLWGNIHSTAVMFPLLLCGNNMVADL